MFASVNSLIDYLSLPDSTPELQGKVVKALKDDKYEVVMEDITTDSEKIVELKSFFELEVGEKVDVLNVNGQYSIHDHLKSYLLLFGLGFVLFFGAIAGFVQVFVFKSAYLEWHWNGSFDFGFSKKKEK